jgi:hypothetical protein
MLAGIVVFLYRIADVLSKIQDWSVVWNPPTIAQILVALAAALVAVGAALKIDLNKLGSS